MRSELLPWVPDFSQIFYHPGNEFIPCGLPMCEGGGIGERKEGERREEGVKG